MTPRRAPVALLLSALSTVIVVASLSAPAQADSPDSPDSSGAPVARPLGATLGVDDPTREEAEEALAVVEEIIEDAAPIDGGVATTPPTEGTDLTLALRDLALSADALGGSDQDTAARLLARPSGGGVECQAGSGLPCDGRIDDHRTPPNSSGVAVHYATSGPHAVPLVSGSYAVYPDYVLNVVNQVRQTYAAAGYRTPISDGGAGGTAEFDIYLANLGPLGLYGYCTSDTPGQATPAPYCVLDNDYAEYGGRSPVENLKVTAAHEYFHAVQFAYDANEARWFMEGTATWAEDEVFTEINDNRQYLPAGPLGLPGQSLSTVKGLSAYGSWIFFRFLSEQFPARVGSMPVIIKELWDRAAGAPSWYDALQQTLAARGTDLTTQFARFAVANRRPSASYSEGAAYKKAHLGRSIKLSSGRRSGQHATKIKSLAAEHVRFRSKVRGSAKLKVSVDVANRAKGGYALVTFKRKGKGVKTKVVKINRKGKGSQRVKFGGKVKWVEVTLVNAGLSKSKSSVRARVVG